MRYTSLFKITFFPILYLFSVLLLSACSNNVRSSLGSLKEVITPRVTPDIPEDYIQSLPYSASLVTVNDRKPILMVLAYVDEITQGHQVVKRLTWVANDGGSITTESGRIIQTAGFNSNNLAGVSSAEYLNSPRPGKLQEWDAIYDWDEGYRYNFLAKVTALPILDEKVTTFLWQQDTQKITEKVYFPKSGYSFDNQFWVSPESNKTEAFTVKSIQKLGPHMDTIQMVMIRPYVEFK
ncbi:YjbF family lipoprotein [Marinomonas agarivorans]|nr:YjbF family lipoprotein [Marinomonas agarivorans]